MNPNDNGWPERPASFPNVMTAAECCQYMRLDDGRAVLAAESMLRHLRRTRGLPCVGRVAGKVLYRRPAVDAWLAAQESRIPDPLLPDETAAGQGLAGGRGNGASLGGRNSLASG